MEKTVKLTEVKQAIDDCTIFLKTYIALANAHAVDFVIDNLWDKYIPPNIQSELLKLDEKELCELPSIALHTSQKSAEVEHEKQNDNISQSDSSIYKKHSTIDTDNSNLKSVNSHLAKPDTYTRVKRDICCCQNDPCSSLVQGCSQLAQLDGILSGSQTSQTKHPNNVKQNSGNEEKSATDSHKVETKQNDSDETWRHSRLESFIKDCIKHSFDGGFRRLLTRKQDIFEADAGLTCLKRREQLLGGDLMSEKKSHEVDVLANLCALLAKKHGCNLVVDVGSGKGYLGTCLSSRYSLQTLSIDSSANNTTSAINRAYNLLRKRSKTRPKTGNDVFNTSCLDESVIETETGDSAACVPQGETVASGHLNKTDSSQTEPPNVTVPTNCVSSDFVPITHFITSETNFLELIRKATLKENDACKEVDECTGILLTGLHTCGDLASSVLKIFSSSPEIQVLCTVGCCYNLLTEETSVLPQMTDVHVCADNQDTPEFGFPVSSYLKQSSLRLGKGARNLAAQSIHRISVNKTLQGKTFFDRALLEKIVVDLTGCRPSGQVSLRNLKKRSRSHYDYIHKAFIKLGLSTEKLTPELVDEYLLFYQIEEFKMAAFFQLRTLMSPCIETLILLDRGCYLLELDSTKSVDIVQLFDPYTSPRCYGLIATKFSGTGPIKYDRSKYDLE